MPKTTMSQKRSVVWKYFTSPLKDEETKKPIVICLLCQEKMAYHNSTGGLLKHIERKHPTTDLRQPSALSLVQVPVPDLAPSFPKRIKPHEPFRSMLKERQDGITERLINFIVNDLKPISTIENDGFINLISALEPSYSIPSKKTVAKRIEERYEESKFKLKSILAEVQYVALAADMWTTIKMESFVEVTVHFLDGCDLKSHILCIKPVDLRHAADNIVNWLLEVTREFNVANKVVAFVTGDGETMVKARRTLESEKDWASVSCASHSLQCCLNAALSIPAIERVLSAGRTLIHHFKRSSVSTAALMKKCHSSNVDVSKLTIDVATRWGSTYEMIRRLLALQQPISAVLANAKVTPASKAAAVEMRIADWEVLQELSKAIEPFAEAVDALGAEKYVSLSSKLPVIRNLKKAMETSQPEALPLPVIQFKQKVREEMEVKFKETWDDVANIATVLDVRFKDKIISSMSIKDTKQLKELLYSQILRMARKESAEQMQPLESQQDAPSCSLTAPATPLPKLLESSYDSVGLEVASNAIYIADEIDRYFMVIDHHENHRSDALGWWSQEKTTFPNLWNVAEKYLCIPATSIQTERPFSATGLTVSELRTGLTGSHVEALMFLKGNKDL